MSRSLQNRSSSAVRVRAGKTPEETAINLARTALAPEMMGQRIVRAAEGDKGLDLDVPVLMKVISEQSTLLSTADQSLIAEHLAAQSLTLQVLGARLIELAMSQSRAGNLEALMKLGLRAMNQSRLTLEAICNQKRLPSVFAENANVCLNQQNHFPAKPTIKDTS